MKNILSIFGIGNNNETDRIREVQGEVKELLEKIEVVGKIGEIIGKIGEIDFDESYARAKRAHELLGGEHANGISYKGFMEAFSDLVEREVKRNALIEEYNDMLTNAGGSEGGSKITFSRIKSTRYSKMFLA